MLAKLHKYNLLQGLKLLLQEHHASGSAPVALSRMMRLLSKTFQQTCWQSEAGGSMAAPEIDALKGVTQGHLCSIQPPQERRVCLPLRQQGSTAQ